MFVADESLGHHLVLSTPVKLAQNLLRDLSKLAQE